MQFFPNISCVQGFTDHNQPDCPVHQKKGGYACQWLDNVDMHIYVKFDQNIQCGSRVIHIFTKW